MLAAEQAQVTDGMKVRGRYADMDAAGNILRPDDITDAEAAGQLARARAAIAAVILAVPVAARMTQQMVTSTSPWKRQRPR